MAHILDRGYGRPTQTVSATVTHIKQMTDDELLAFLTSTDEADSGAGTALEAEGAGKFN